MVRSKVEHKNKIIVLSSTNIIMCWHKQIWVKQMITLTTITSNLSNREISVFRIIVMIHQDVVASKGDRLHSKLQPCNETTSIVSFDSVVCVFAEHCWSLHWFTRFIVGWSVTWPRPLNAILAIDDLDFPIQHHWHPKGRFNGESSQCSTRSDPQIQFSGYQGRSQSV